MERVLVLSAKPYSVKDEGSSIANEGVSIFFIDPAFVDSSKEHKGVDVLKTSLPLSNYHQLAQVPGWYDLDMRMRPGQGGKPVLKAVSAKWVGDFSFPANLEGEAPALLKVSA